MSQSGSRWNLHSTVPASPNTPNISAVDFTYTPSADLENRSPPPLPSDPPEDDVLLVKYMGVTHSTKFPADSIGDGTLTVNDLRKRAATLGISNILDDIRLRLLYKGAELKDVWRACRDYGLENQSEILCIISEVEIESDDSDRSLHLEGSLQESSKRKVESSQKSRKKARRDGVSARSSQSPEGEELATLRKSLDPPEVSLRSLDAGEIRQRLDITDINDAEYAATGGAVGLQGGSAPPSTRDNDFSPPQATEPFSSFEDTQERLPPGWGSQADNFDRAYDVDQNIQRTTSSWPVTSDRSQPMSSQTPSTATHITTDASEHVKSGRTVGIDMNDPVVLDTYTQLILLQEHTTKEELIFENPTDSMQRTLLALASQLTLEYDYSLQSRQIRISKVSDHENVSPNHDLDANPKSLGDKNNFSTSCTECQRRKQKCNRAKDRPCNNCARRYPPTACTYNIRGITVTPKPYNITPPMADSYNSEASHFSPYFSFPEPHLPDVALGKHRRIKRNGSASTNSTVSSVRFTVIELIISKFVEDSELSSLYAEAVKRMGNARFVRNQRRLLKKFFLDLRSRTQNLLQEEAIRILRGRAERTSMAEQVWRLMNPTNPSLIAGMAALKNQNPDKKMQLKRLLGPQKDNSTNKPEQDIASNPSEESESGSEGSNSVHDEAKYPNMELATEFLLGGSPFKQYKTNIRNFLRLDSEMWSPDTLQEHIVKGDITPVAKILENHFEDVAQLDFDWLHELLDIGCNFEEMARLLIDGENASPWILLDHPTSVQATPQQRLHQPNCVHSGGQKIQTTPRVITTNFQNIVTQQPNSVSSPKATVNELCGIAGAIPLIQSNPDWISCVKFDGIANSIARIRYCSPEEDSEGGPDGVSERALLRTLSALDRVSTAVGLLQQSGLCCDSFTILRLIQSENNVTYIELCPIDIALIERLRSELQRWSENRKNHDFLRLATMIASRVLGVVNEGLGGIASLPPRLPLDQVASLHTCALAAQVLTLGLVSYAQAHSGYLHPEFLVEPLSEVHLLGNAGDADCAPIMVKFLDFTCLRDMVRDSVLVFCVKDDKALSQGKTSFDLLASPEDLADTWSPARFVTDTSMSDGYAKLYAVEVGGGTIHRIDGTSRKFHWSLGSKRYCTSKTTFNSNEKILIGAITVNDNCPLDETQSWRDPATNAYIRHLGTREATWELREKQVGGQAGQYAVLAFNATYIKQDGVTLKQQQLMLPFNEIDLAFLNSTCGLQISFCTGVARRVALRELLADVMVPFVESRASKPVHWKKLKIQNIVENFRNGDLDVWFERLAPELSETAIMIVRSMLEVLKDTGIDRNGEELVVAWVRKESPYSCLRLRCEKTSLWARILADSEDCATFACITPLCFEVEKHKCRGLKTAPWHNVTKMLDTAVCPQLSNRQLQAVANTIAPWTLKHNVSYWIGKSGSNLIAKVWLTNEDDEPLLVIRQKVIPEKYRSRMPRGLVERLGRLREKQASDAVAKQVVILAEM